MKRLVLLIALLLVSWSSAPQAQTTRPVYISPIDGTGTDLDPLRSRCDGLAGAGSVKLTPWGVNRYLCTSDALPVNTVGVVQLGDSLLDNLTPARRAALETLIGRPLTGLTVQEVIVEILQSKLRPGRDGKLKIYLSGQVPIYQQTAWVPFRDYGLVADATNFALQLIEPPLAWAASFTDNFNVADNATLSGQLTWTEHFGTALSTASNMARYTSGGTAADGRADVDTATDSQRVGVTLVTTGSHGAATEVTARVIARQDGTATRTHYLFDAAVVLGSNKCRLRERIAGTLSNITSAACSPAGGDHLELVVDGSTLTAYINSAVVVGPTTDASITGNTRGGIAGFADVAGPTIDLDDFHIADELTVFGPLRRRAS